MPRVSVIMGAYNCSNVIGHAIKSIQNQTFTDWEFIICDDCSTDNTLDVIRQYALNDKRIVAIYNKQNMHLAYSLNQCLKYAKGEYVARMDADDICLPDRLRCQVDFLDHHPQYSVVGGAVLLFNEKGDKDILRNKEIPNVRQMKYGVPFFHPTIMMRRDVYKDLDGYIVSERTKRGQDLDLWFRFFAKGYKGYNLQNPVLKYHDDISDYSKKRGFRKAKSTATTLFLGFRSNKFPWYDYIWVLPPLLKLLLPNSIVYWAHNKKNHEKNLI